MKLSLFKKGETVTVIALFDKLTGEFRAYDHVVMSCGEKRMVLKSKMSGFVDSSFSGCHIGFWLNRADDGRPACHYAGRGVFKVLTNPETRASILKRCQAQWLRWETKQNQLSYNRHWHQKDTSEAYLASLSRDLHFRRENLARLEAEGY